MNAHDIFGTIRQKSKDEEVPLSTFFVQIQPKSFEKIVLHVLFDCYSSETIHLSIEK
jgi:hypothetical protein